jgi:hypothetical protein
MDTCGLVLLRVGYQCLQHVGGFHVRLPQFHIKYYSIIILWNVRVKFGDPVCLNSSERGLMVFLCKKRKEDMFLIHFC